jgi:rhamnulokinase
VQDKTARALTGVRRTESTNASTAGLLHAGAGAWTRDLLDRLDIPAGLLPPLISPGDVIGPVTTAAGCRARRHRG